VLAPVVAASASATAAKGKGKAASSDASQVRKGKEQGNTVKGKPKSQNNTSLEVPDSQPPSCHGMQQLPAPQESAPLVCGGSGKATKGVGRKGKARALPAAPAVPARETTLEPAAPSARERKHKASSTKEFEDPESQSSHDAPQLDGKRQKTSPPEQGLAQPQAPALPAPIAASKKGKGEAVAPVYSSALVASDLLPPALSTRFGANKRGIMFPVRCEGGESRASAAAPVSAVAALEIPKLPALRRSTRTRLGSRPSPRPAHGLFRVLRSRPPPPVLAAGVIKKPSTSNKMKKGKGKDKGKSKTPRSPPFNSTEAINAAVIDAEADLLLEMARNALRKEFSGRLPDGRSLTPNPPSGGGMGKSVFEGRARDPLFSPYRDPSLGRGTAEEEAGDKDPARAGDELQGEALADWVRAGAENVNLHQHWTTLAEPDGRGYRLGDNERARGVSPTAAAEEEEEYEKEQSPLRPRSRGNGSRSPPGRGRSGSPSSPAMSPWSRGCFEECTQLG